MATHLTRALVIVACILWVVFLVIVMKELPLVFPLVLGLVTSAVGAFRILGPDKRSIRLVNKFLKAAEESR